MAPQVALDDHRKVQNRGCDHFALNPPQIIVELRGKERHQGYRRFRIDAASRDEARDEIADEQFSGSKADRDNLVGHRIHEARKPGREPFVPEPPQLPRRVSIL